MDCYLSVVSVSYTAYKQRSILMYYMNGGFNNIKGINNNNNNNNNNNK